MDSFVQRINSVCLEFIHLPHTLLPICILHFYIVLLLKGYFLVISAHQACDIIAIRQ